MNTQEKINKLFFGIIKDYSETERKQLFEIANLSEDELRKEFTQYIPLITKENFRFDYDLMTMKIEDVPFLTKSKRLENVLISADIKQIWQLYVWPQQHPPHSLFRNSESPFMWSFIRFYGSGKTTAAQLIDTFQILGLPPIDTVTFTYQELELLEESK